MNFERYFDKQLTAYGSDIKAWPLWWRVVLPLLLKLQPKLAKQWHAALEDERRMERMLTQLPQLTLSPQMQARLASISSRPQASLGPTPTLPVWRLGMSTALASVMLGFLLGAGGLLAPPDAAADFELDSTANYEVSEWLAEAEE